MQAINSTQDVNVENCNVQGTNVADRLGLQEAANSDSLDRQSRPSFLRRFNVAGILSAILAIGYLIAFLDSLNGRWFNPSWTTDDATQQTYPLYDAMYPDLFKDDLVSEVMRGCLPPAHYWVSYGITLLTQNPIMTGHWVMLIQMSVALLAMLLAVRRFSGSYVPAFLSVMWLLHSRNTIQRMTGGLPRGWTPAIFGVFLYFAATKNHVGALATILIGSMLNPPGAMIIGLAYGMIMVWRWISAKDKERELARSRVFRAAAIAPMFLVVALTVVQRPAHIGQMVSLEEATRMPEFSRPNGRFPFVPLSPLYKEVKRVGFQAFIGRLYTPAPFWRDNVIWMVPTALLAILAVGALRKIWAIPVELLCFGAASVIAYLLSREFAFKLFVPDRHLRIPMVVFMITAFTVGLWRGLNLSRNGVEDSDRTSSSAIKKCWPTLISYIGLGLVIYQCSADGLQGSANLDYAAFKKGEVHSWLRENAPENSMIACHPNHCDGMQLFAARRAFVTTETSHPFYPRYNQEMRRRSEISLRAQYAENLNELVLLLEPEGITHFVFFRPDFESGRLSNATYHSPLDRLVKQLVNRPSGQFAYNLLPKRLEPDNFPFLKFIDKFSLVIDVRELSDFLRSRGWSPPQASLGASINRHAATRKMIVATGAVDQRDLAS